MSYESEMLEKYNMPTKKEVEVELLKILFNHNGLIKEFSSDENIVGELADSFSLNEEQRTAVLERIYHKENRIVKSPLWHRLLYRAADALAKENLVTRPSITLILNNKKEWMLTEEGFDKALNILNIPIHHKENLAIKSYEVEKIVKKIKEQQKPIIYDIFDRNKNIQRVSKEVKLRNRGFRHAVIEVYNCRCAVCGFKLNTPNNLNWAVEAAHIVPHSCNGRDDVWNGLALCRLHHWAFDAGWFSLQDDFRIIVSSKTNDLPNSYAKINDYDFFKSMKENNSSIILPHNTNNYPDLSALKWHRENILYN